MNLADEPGTKRTCGLGLKSDSFAFNNWLCWMWSFIHQCVSERSRWLYCCGIGLWSRGLLPPRPLQLPQTLARPHADVQLMFRAGCHRGRSTCGEGLRRRRQWQERDGDNRSVTHINTCRWHTPQHPHWVTTPYCVFKSSWIIHADPFRPPWCHQRLSCRTRISEEFASLAATDKQLRLE